MNKIQTYISELDNVNSLFQDRQSLINVANVMFRYFECEKLATKMIKASEKKEKKDFKQRDEQNFKVNQVNLALQFFSIDIDNNIILRLFGGGNKAYNQCSIRKIRNIFVHDVTEYVVKVIVERKDEMMKDMDVFLNMIRNQFQNQKGNL